MQGSRETVRVSSTRGETRGRGAGKEFTERFDKYSFPSRKPQSVETVTVSLSHWKKLPEYGQTPLIHANEAIESVRINGVSV